MVGHDFGGTSISYAMELFPSKIAKAIFVSAAMLTSGQSTLNLFAQQVCPSLHTVLYSKTHSINVVVLSQICLVFVFIN